jgi:hypothetical protein
VLLLEVITDNEVLITAEPSSFQFHSRPSFYEDTDQVPIFMISQPIRLKHVKPASEHCFHPKSENRIQLESVALRGIHYTLCLLFSSQAGRDSFSKTAHKEALVTSHARELFFPPLLLITFHQSIRQIAARSNKNN